MREMNVGLVINAIRRHEPIYRADVAARTGLSRATVTEITAQLLAQGWIHEVGLGESARGRRPVLLRLNRDSRFCVGVKIGPDLVSAAVGDLGANLFPTVSLPVQTRGSAYVIDLVEECYRSALAVAGVDPDNVVGLGVVLPGVVDHDAGTSVAAPLISWSNVPLRLVLQERLGIPVFLENDANAFALSEYEYGAGRGHTHVVGVTLGVGIGAGIVLDGRIYRGSRFGAGELGHMNVLPGGPQCGCGRRGCLEAVAGDDAIARMAAEEVRGGEMPVARDLVAGDAAKITRQIVVEAARSGDPKAVEVLRRSGEWIGSGLANVVNLLNPEVIVVGGELLEQAGDLILGPVREAVYRGTFTVLGNELEVVGTALGETSWLIGAVTLVLQEVFRMPVAAHGAASPIALVTGLGGTT